MRIKRIFNIYSILLLLLTFASSAAAGWMFYNVNKARTSYELISHFQVEVNQIASITSDYLLFGEQHTVDQWNVLYANLAPVIDSLKGGTDCPDCLDEIRSTYGVIKTVFDRLTDATPASEYRTQLASQLFVHIHELQYDARNLAYAFSATIRRTGTSVSIMMSAIAVLFLAFVANAFLFMRTRVLRPLEQQRLAVLNSFQGEYSYDHFPPHDDELGDLSNAFKTIIDEKNRAEKLAQLTASLEAKNAELEQVIYAASHDLRSPLVNVDGYGRELQESFSELRQVLAKEHDSPAALQQATELINEDIMESIRFIRSSATKMDRLLLGLLKLSRLGREAIKMQHVEMNPILDSIAASLDFQIKEAGIQLHIEPLPPCHGDPTQVEQVFTNILDNAVKYLDPNRPGVIRVSGSSSGEYSTYCVEDNGIGIDEKHRQKIFQIFHRVNIGNRKGEGLGLAIVERIVNKHGGSIWVGTPTDHGTRFYVKLPTHDGK